MQLFFDQDEKEIFLIEKYFHLEGNKVVTKRKIKCP